MKHVFRVEASYNNEWVAYYHDNKLLIAVPEYEQARLESGMCLFNDVKIHDIDITGNPDLIERILSSEAGEEDALAKMILDHHVNMILNQMTSAKEKVSLTASHGCEYTSGYVSEDESIVVSRDYRWNLWVNGLLIDSCVYRNDLAERCNLKLINSNGEVA